MIISFILICPGLHLNYYKLFIYDKCFRRYSTTSMSLPVNCVKGPFYTNRTHPFVLNKLLCDTLNSYAFKEYQDN